MAKKNTPNHAGYMTRQQIAAEYGIDRKTLRRKMKKAGIFPPDGLLDRKWQKAIYEALNYPPGISKTDFADF
ncbi:MAG: hypothetical protein ACE5FF_12780 [Saprospiraceae bacterium]